MTDELVGEVVGEVNFNRLIEEFPAMALFDPLVGQTIARFCAMLVIKGYPPEKMQELIDEDETVLMLAGSLYAQINGNPQIGCDDHSNRRLRRG
jgi:hypothetical protein